MLKGGMMQRLIFEGNVLKEVTNNGIEKQNKLEEMLDTMKGVDGTILEDLFNVISKDNKYRLTDMSWDMKAKYEKDVKELRELLSTGQNITSPQRFDCIPIIDTIPCHSPEFKTPDGAKVMDTSSVCPTPKKAKVKL
ncbi:hypothetical protein V6N13_104335 [Hibiscus sabdariffa]